MAAKLTFYICNLKLLKSLIRGLLRFPKVVDVRVRICWTGLVLLDLFFVGIYRIVRKKIDLPESSESESDSLSFTSLLLYWKEGFCYPIF